MIVAKSSFGADEEFFEYRSGWSSHRQWRLNTARAKRIKATYEIRLRSVVGGESQQIAMCLLEDVPTHQGMAWTLPVMKTVRLNPLTGRKRTNHNDGKRETDGVSSHPVLLSTQTQKEITDLKSDTGKNTWRLTESCIESEIDVSCGN